MKVRLKLDAIKQLMLKNGIFSWSELARRVGVDESTISLIRRGKREVGPKVRKLILDYFQVSPEEVFYFAPEITKCQEMCVWATKSNHKDAGQNNLGALHHPHHSRGNSRPQDCRNGCQGISEEGTTRVGSRQCGEEIIPERTLRGG